MNIIVSFCLTNTYAQSPDFSQTNGHSGYGGSTVALRGLWSVTDNPAGFVIEDRAFTGAGYSSPFMIDALSVKTAAAGIRIGNGSFGASIIRFGNTDYSETIGSLVFSRPFGPKFSAGIRFNYFGSNTNGEYQPVRYITFDAGFIYSVNSQLTLGLHLINPGQAKRKGTYPEYLPVIIRTGFCMFIDKKVIWMSELEKEIRSSPKCKMGLGFNLSGTICLKTGISTSPLMLWSGIELNLHSFILDMSTGYHQQLGISPGLNISRSFE